MNRWRACERGTVGCKKGACLGTDRCYDTLFDFADAMLRVLTPYNGAADATYALSYVQPPMSSAVLRLIARNLLFEMQLSREDRGFAYAVIDKMCTSIQKKESQVRFPGEKDLT